MPYEKGECGNPAGRPLGSRNRATLLMESLMADDAEAIGRKAIEMAKGGDLAAIRLCLDRLALSRRREAVHAQANGCHIALFGHLDRLAPDRLGVVRQQTFHQQRCPIA